MQTTTIEETNLGVIESMYEAFLRGDVGFIVDQQAEGAKWFIHGDSLVPWTGDFSGKANVARFFSTITDNVAVLGFEPLQHVAQGDTVVSIGTFSARAEATG